MHLSDVGGDSPKVGRKSPPNIDRLESCVIRVAVLRRTGSVAAPHTGQSHQHSTTLWTRHHQPRVQITFPPPAGQADTVCHLADISRMIGWLLAAAAVI